MKTKPERDAKPFALEPKPPLSGPEKARLNELESVVARNRQGFFELVFALWEIKQANLWREAFDSWEQYVQTRLRMSRPHSYRLLGAAELLHRLDPVSLGDKAGRDAWLEQNGDWLPRNERAYRQVQALTEKDLEPGTLTQLFQVASGHKGKQDDIESAATRKAAIELKLLPPPEPKVSAAQARWEEILDKVSSVIADLWPSQQWGVQVSRLHEVQRLVKEGMALCGTRGKGAAKKRNGTARTRGGRKVRRSQEVSVDDGGARGPAAALAE